MNPTKIRILCKLSSDIYDIVVRQFEISPLELEIIENVKSLNEITKINLNDVQLLLIQEEINISIETQAKIKKIKENVPSIVIFVLTLNGSISDSVKYIKCGANNYLTKVDFPSIVQEFRSEFDSIENTKSTLIQLEEISETDYNLIKILDYAPFLLIIERISDKKIVKINNTVSESFNFSPNFELDKRFEDLEIWPDSQELPKLRASLEINNYLNNYELSLLIHGEKRTFLFSTINLEINEEDCTVYMGMDISYKMQAELEMKEALKKQTELNALKGLFISMVSHEFRTPLSAIMLSTDLLKRYSDKWNEEEKLKHFNRIQTTVLKMTKLMENVLLIGKIDMGKFVVKPENFDLLNYVKSHVDNLDSLVDGKHILNYNFNEYQGKTIFDENIIGLVVHNIVANAIKYTPKGGEISINLAINDEFLKFEVSDKGIGILEEDKPHIFEYFYRGKNVGPIDGYGLGLAIVQKCIDSHKGNIIVESTAGEGAKFTVQIPNNLQSKDIVFTM